MYEGPDCYVQEGVYRHLSLKALLSEVHKSTMELLYYHDRVEIEV